jgi:hypothetical protein
MPCDHKQPPTPITSPPHPIAPADSCSLAPHAPVSPSGRMSHSSFGVSLAAAGLSLQLVLLATVASFRWCFFLLPLP